MTPIKSIIGAKLSTHSVAVTLTASQIASVNAAAVAGTLVASQIASVNASVVSGALSSATIPTAQLSGQISAAQIEANSIGTNQLAAQSVTAANLVITSTGAALNQDPNCNDITAFSVSSSGSAVVVSVTDNTPGQVGATALEFTVPDSGATDIRLSTGPVPIAFGKSYRVTALVRSISGAGTSFFVRCFQFPGTVPQQSGVPSGSVANSLGLEGLTVTTAWTRYEATFSPASGTTWCALELEAVATVTEVFEIQDWRIEEQVPGSLVVNGATTATQIAASTITGGNIAAETITGSNLVANTITAGQIAAATITGTNIAAGTITGSNLVAGTITAGEIAA